MSWLNRLLFVALIAAASAYLPEYSASDDEDLLRVQREREDLRTANGALAEEIRGLEAEIEALHRRSPDLQSDLQPGLQEDPRHAERVDRELARVAREDLNLVKPGEVVFELERPTSEAKR